MTDRRTDGRTDPVCIFPANFVGAGDNYEVMIRKRKHDMEFMRELKSELLALWVCVPINILVLSNVFLNGRLWAGYFGRVALFLTYNKFYSHNMTLSFKDPFCKDEHCLDYSIWKIV